MSPHPSREGRGSLPDRVVSFRVVQSESRGEGESGGGEMGGGLTNINRDGVDVQLKLRSPS